MVKTGGGGVVLSPSKKTDVFTSGSEAMTLKTMQGGNGGEAVPRVGKNDSQEDGIARNVVRPH